MLLKIVESYNCDGYAPKVSSHGYRHIYGCVVTKVVSEYVYEIEDLAGKIFEVRVQRLKRYDTKTSLINKEEILAQYVFNAAEFEVDKFLDVRFDKRDGTAEVLVKWRGLDTLFNSWEPVGKIYEQLPELFVHFVQRNLHKPRFHRLWKQLGFSESKGKEAMSNSFRND
jgi:hypothetical protein